MTSTETLLACCVVGLACFIGGQAVASNDAGSARSFLPRATRHEAEGAIDMGSARSSARTRPPTLAEATPRFAPHLAPDAAPLTHGEELLVATPLLLPEARPTMPAEEVRRRLRLGMDGTFMADLLRSRDSTLARWPDRITRPLRVFIREDEGLPAWNPDFLPAVRDAFATWAQTGLPLRFTFVVDSASADVHVRFVERFPNGISGRTVWSRDSDYWLVAGDIQLAVSHPDGASVTPPQMRAIALHEVGHLIGLDHAASPDHIMSARVRVRELSEADRSTARLVYSVPAGSLR